VIAIINDQVLTEDGESMLLDQLVRRLPNMDSTLFAATNGADLLAYLDNMFAVPYPTVWQWRTTDISREIPASNPKIKYVRSVTVAVQFFGFREIGEKSQYHRLIDPVTMYGKDLLTGSESRIVQLLNWAVALRDWCSQNGLEVRPTTGGISAQLLTDPRFYPEARRKVPAATNEQVRGHLPGNHYYLDVEPSPEREYNAHYIDQHRAHHYHAKLIHFPHANHLYAYGNFHNVESGYYRNQPSPQFMGLYCLDLQLPEDAVAFSWLINEDLDDIAAGKLACRYLYTNELTHVLDMGYKILGIRAAWGSTHRDTGLNNLAAWACDQLDKHNDPVWLKPLLLSAYGCLACRGDHAETVFRIAKSGEEKTFATGKRRLTGLSTKRPHKLEPKIVNVLHRGMIEAATRSESIGLAQHLTLHGQRVIQIYADGVIAEASDDLPLPLLPEPWEVKHNLTHYQPLSRQALLSDQITRLPGIGHADLRAYNERRTIEHVIPQANTN